MKSILKYTPIVIPVLVFMITFHILYCELYYQVNFAETLASSREYIFTISGVLSGIIMAYLTSKVLQIREERIAKLPQINDLTQKIHRFRKIVHNILSSDLIPKEARNFVDYNYKGLTFYDYRENIFVDSQPTQQSTNYISDPKRRELSNLYLELRAFVPKNHDLDETLYSQFEVSKFYSTQLLEKWVKYKCGNGLFYYFDYRYTENKFNFDINDTSKNEILDCCLQIDKERYQGMPFNAKLLATLGTQIQDIISKLFETQLSAEKGLPKIINYLFFIFVLLVLFGIMTPLLSNIFKLSPICDVFSISVIIGICTYVILSFYGFMKQEIKIGKIIIKV